MKPDIKKLYAEVDIVRKVEGMSWRQLGKKLGISASTFTRMSHGRNPDLATFIALVWWLNVPFDRFVKGRR